jgi:16S rRNA (adenine1518-N6/adenine1519-N6)-dimethyltransferase
VGVPNVKVIEGDVLKAEVPYFNKIVSIPPYNISSKLLLWLFKKDFDCAVLVFQKEFVNRLVAPIGSEDYGWLTVVTYYHTEVELLESVPKRMFFPQPKIDSVITCLKPKQPRPFTIRDNASFEKFVRLLFTQRNKKIRNAVLPYVKSIRAVSKQDATEIADSLPFCDKRVRELAPEDFGALANDLSR